MKYTYTFLCVFTVMLSACNQATVKDIKSQFYSVPHGSEFILNKPVTIKANTGRTFFQNGSTIKEKSLNIYYPHCSITMNNIVNRNRVLKPTTFIVYKVVDEEEHAQLNILYAAIKSFGHADGPSIIGQASYYYIKSADEPDVRTLECVQWGDPFYVKYVSISDVQNVLGDYFSLKLAD